MSGLQLPRLSFERSRVHKGQDLCICCYGMLPKVWFLLRSANPRRCRLVETGDFLGSLLWLVDVNPLKEKLITEVRYVCVNTSWT